MPGETDRAIVSEPEPFEHHDTAPAPHAKTGGNARIGGNLPQLTDNAGWFLVVLSYPFRKPGSRLDVVVQHVLGDERSPPLFDPDQAVAR